MSTHKLLHKQTVMNWAIHCTTKATLLVIHNEGKFQVKAMIPAPACVTLHIQGERKGNLIVPQWLSVLFEPTYGLHICTAVLIPSVADWELCGEFHLANSKNYSCLLLLQFLLYKTIDALTQMIISHWIWITMLYFPLKAIL